MYSVVVRVKDSGHNLGTRRTKKRHSRTGARPLNLSHDPFEPSSTFVVDEVAVPAALRGCSLCAMGVRKDAAQASGRALVVTLGFIEG